MIPTYAEAIQQQEDEFLKQLATGRFKPVVFPWTWLNFFLLVIAIYTAPARRSRHDRGIDLLVFVAIVATSVWSLLRYRSPGIAGSVVIGLNACMCTIFALNFLVLRDPRQIKRVNLTIRGSSNKSDRLTKDDEYGIQKWQAIPDQHWPRFWWTLDLIACMRALKWSWNPQEVCSELLLKPTHDLSRFYRRHLIRFICGYLALDILKCIMIADPHFYGFIDCQAPRALQFLPLWALHAYRVSLAAAGVFSSVQYFGSGWALLQVGILGPRLLGINGLPCMYPPLFGSPVAVLNHGLTGFWSHTWHQIFRAHFSSVGDKAASWSGLHIDPKRHDSLHGIVRLFTVFFASGALHACASYTLLSPSDPKSSFLCFAVQPVGILVEAKLSEIVRPYTQHLGSHALLGHLANSTFCLVWLILTCAPLANDFSRGGQWMLEPVPVSFTRGLGMSSQDR